MGTRAMLITTQVAARSMIAFRTPSDDCAGKVINVAGMGGTSDGGAGALRGGEGGGHGADPGRRARARGRTASPSTASARATCSTRWALAGSGPGTSTRGRRCPRSAASPSRSDVARAALFLASSDSDYLTGDALNVSGGMVAALTRLAGMRARGLGRAVRRGPAVVGGAQPADRRAAGRPAAGRRRRPGRGGGAARALAGRPRLAGHRGRLLRRRARPRPRRSRAPTRSPGCTPTSSPGRRPRRAWTSCSSPTCTCPRTRPSAAARPCGRLAAPGRPAARARPRRREHRRRCRRAAGPGDPAQRRAAGAGRGPARVDRLEQVRRETPAGTALDTLLWGRRPA